MDTILAASRARNRRGSAQNRPRMRSNVAPDKTAALPYPAIAESRVHTPEQARKMLKIGAAKFYMDCAKQT